MSKLLIAAALAAATLSSQAFAADSDDAPVTRSVSAAGVNFNNSGQVEAFYTRLEKAARAVCDSYSANGRVTAADRACASKALADAVRQTDKPMLTALHNGSHGERAYAARTDR